VRIQQSVLLLLVTGRASLATLYIVARHRRYICSTPLRGLSRTRSTSSAPTYEATTSTWRSLPRPTSSPNIQTASFQCRDIQCYAEIGIVGEEAASHYMYDPLCRSLPGLSPETIVRSSYCHCCVNGTFIGSLYHPPRPAYTVESLLNYIEQCVVELNRDYRSSNIVLAGDFNLLPESAVVERTGFDQLV